MSTELRQALEQVARRYREVRLWGGLALCWMVWALFGAALSIVLARPANATMPDGSLLAGFVVLTLLSGGIAALLALRSARDLRWVARQVEASHPELGTGLLAAVEQGAAGTDAPLGYLQSAVVGQMLEHGRTHDWCAVVPGRNLRAAQAAHVLALGVLLCACGLLVGRARTHASTRATLAARGAVSGLQVDPGNTEIERGSSLLVIARFNETVPAEAKLVLESTAEPTASQAMTRSLEDPMFAARVESVEHDLGYHVEYGGQSSPTYRVKVFEYPELERADARLVFPRYTALEPRTVEDIRHVTAVEGTELTLLLRLNKDVAAARLRDEKGQGIILAPVAGEGHTYRASFPLSDSRRYKLQLLDRENRANKRDAEIVVNVTRNRPAVVTMAQPAHDVRVSPLEELRLKAELEDDFGVLRHGLSYAVGGQEPRDIELKGPASSTRHVRAEHLLDFESLHAAPDQLVTYFFWAEDYGPDGKPRRSSGDMFFAEVRPFEEIFRQGEQPPGGSAENEEQQGGNGQQAEQLAELQKQIINGTWKLIRRETGAKPSAKFADDTKTLLESQQSVIQQAGPLGERLRDARSKASLEQAVRFMKVAEKHLAEAAKTATVAEHRAALTAEQAAYQALLKLRAREFEVTRNNNARQRGRGGQARGGPSQRQLQQLELSNDENRYEDQSSARNQQQRLSQREQEQAENRQVLNRLRELAQRQNDLNERLKELQSALEEARTPQARDEIQRQLKRLREQEQQILRDTEELQERMENEQNQERMAEARQRIEDSRNHVRQASEALEQGRLSQAVTEGTRAGRQLNDLREEIRKTASGRFNEEMTEMRKEARRLDDEQKKLNDQLDAWNKRPEHTLRDTDQRKQVREGLKDQGKRLDQLLDQMRKTVQEAEETEPILAKGLYDAERKATEQNIPDALKAAEQLAEVGVAEDAAKAGQFAGQGLQRLREGVERAAESVLGDETAALRRARSEVDDLADQLNREIARATEGQQPSERRPDQAQRKGQRAGRNPQGQQQGEQAQQGEQEGQQGEPGRQNGQGQQQGQRGQQQGQDGQQGQQGQGGQQQGQQGQQGQGGQQQGQGGQQQGQPGQQGQGGQPQGQGGNQQGVGNGQRGQGGVRQQGGRQAGGDQFGGMGGGGPSELERALQGIANRPRGPITGEGFREWSDRMRDVEELLEDPELRAEAARIRDRVRGAREEFKRHARMPDWNQLKTMVADPIHELRERIAEEVRRRESPDALVPIDRDPVPPQYAEGVRRYYERLGSGR